MFATAKTLTSPKAGAKKAKQVEIDIEKLEAFAAVTAVIKNLETVKASLEAEVKTKMTEYFVDTGCEKKARPDNFRGIEGDASASCELRIRSTNSVVSPEEEARLAAVGIKAATITIQHGTFVINPAYLGDGDLLQRVEKALKGVKNIPEDFIMKQEEVSKKVCPDNALDVLFTLENHQATDLLPLVGVLGVKPKLDATDERAFEIVNQLLHPVKEEDETPAPPIPVGNEPEVRRGRRGRTA